MNLPCLRDSQGVRGAGPECVEGSQEKVRKAGRVLWVVWSRGLTALGLSLVASCWLLQRTEESGGGEEGSEEASQKVTATAQARGVVVQPKR